MDETLQPRSGIAVVIDYIKRVPITTLIISGFFILLLIVGAFLNFSIVGLISDSIQRFGVWGLLVLAMVPSIQSGVGPNFALPVGICSGLLAMVISMSMMLMGWQLLIVSALFAIIIGAGFGYVYGILMNKVKGSEMAIATYTGFAITFLFAVVWTLYPFANEYMGFFLGEGLRAMMSLEPFRAQGLLDNLLQFSIGGFTFRTGTLLVVAVACLLMWLFFRSKAGISISAVGMNPVFAKAAGLNVDRSRLIANMISTAVGAVGIVVYAQGFGFVQLYDFPLWFGFAAVAAVMVGGASAQRAKVMHVIVGAFLYQAIITTGPVVFSGLLADSGASIADATRMVIQNGVILYALMQLKGGGK